MVTKFINRCRKATCSFAMRPWNLVCAGAATLLGILVLFVVHRNVGAALSRRDAISLISDDFNPDPTAFSTEKLPRDARFMCSIGNGHISTDIFSDTVYMNGLYNGEKGESHRARIPGWCNIRLHSTLSNSSLRPIYTLNTTAGVFTVHVNREWSIVDQRVYAHRFYTRAIVNQISITAKHQADLKRDHHARYVDLSFNPGHESEDINFDDKKEMKIGNRFIWTACGRTKILEDPKYQEQPSTVCVCWTHVPGRLTIPRHGQVRHTFVMTADTDKEVAMQELLDVLQETEDNLFRKHCDEWRKLRDYGGIEIVGNTELAKIVNGAMYYLLSSLPSFQTNQPHGLFYGLSPGGLSRGGYLADYEGHNFWDTETWMYPALLLFYPEYGRILLKYRMSMMQAAYDLARLTNHEGIRFPWESAFTGTETTQPCCPEVAEYQHHITGCVAYAIRQYISVTEDLQWLKDGGYGMIAEIAKFWTSRMEFNEATGFYDIKGVMGPDEDHYNVTNSVFTNVVAGYSLYLGDYANCLCKNFTIQRNWTDVAQHIALPYDVALDYHPQFDGYERGSRIKQADAVLLGFPLQYPMNRSTRANDLMYYENVTRESGPAMTWSMHAIGHLRLENSQHAAEYFNKSYQLHVREPFKIWTEYRKPKVGAVNFLTGMGGFLQAIIFGYAGFNIHLDRLEIIKPQILPNTTKLKLNNVKYLGTEMTLDITEKNITLRVISVDPNRLLEIVIRNNNKISLKQGILITLHGGGPFRIQKVDRGECAIPSDVIGKKKVGS